MNLKACTAQINAHGRSQISAMIQSSTDKNKFVTIAHDGLIKLWSLQTLLPVSSARIRCGYLTSLLNYDKGYLVGTGNGQIIKFSANLQREWTKKIHSDCVNDFLQTDLYLISIGSDGKMTIMLKTTLTIQKELEMGVPLEKMTRIGQEIYVSGNPSFKIDLRTFEVMQLGRSFQFLEHKGRILGCSDEKGLQILNLGSTRQAIHCHFMLQFKSHIVTVSQGLIGIVDFERSNEGDEQVSYSMYRVSNLRKGYSIKAGFEYEKGILLAGEDGYVYRFEFEFEI